jgi:cytochrome c-type biogenesis protein CcmH/NrfG
MNILLSRQLMRLIIVSSFGTLFLCSLGCPNKDEGEPVGQGEARISGKAYRELVSAFYVGLRSYEVGEKLAEFKDLSRTQLREAVKIAPKEPAVWMNLALIEQVHFVNGTGAIEAIEKAQALLPNNSRIQTLYGFILTRQGKTPEAIAKFQKAIEIDPNDLTARYQLCDALEANSTPDSPNQIKAHAEKILEKRPDNLAVLILYGKNAAERKDVTTLKCAIERITKLKNATWDEKANARLAEIQKGANQPDISQVATEFQFLKNLLKANHRYDRDKNQFKVDLPFERFLTLPTPPANPAPADMALTLTEEPVKEADASAKWTYVRPIVLKPELIKDTADKFKIEAIPEGPQGYIFANGSKIQIATGEGKNVSLPFPSGSKSLPPHAASIVPIDFTYDFRPDLVVAGEGGIRWYAQDKAANFSDVTAATKLPATATNRAYFGAWAIDYDIEGDLDLLAAPMKGAPAVFRNNGDGTWKEIQPFTGAKNIRALVWADLDNDGDQDVVMATEEGTLLFYQNERAGVFSAWGEAKGIGKVLALTAADLPRSGKFHVVALQEGGKISTITRSEDTNDWEVKEIANWQNLLPDGSEALLTADLDNNGSLDLIATNGAASAVWLSDPKGAFTQLNVPLKAHSLQISSVAIEGRLTPLGIGVDGKPVRLINRGTKNYHWQEFRPRADFVALAPQTNIAKGSDRINSYGIGGALEMRAALLYQKQLITEPTVHFGLGENTNTDAIRIVWTNGYVRADFAKNLKIDVAQHAPYRLGGSCPWLYGWNGKEMALITDCIWRSPLGMRINAQATAGIVQTEDWIKIRGDQLQPHDGYYDLRICAELWETHFFDHLSLMAVDHPADTEVWIDERFSIPPPPLKVITTDKTRAVLQAIDDNGEDVTTIVNRRDENYLDTFGRGQYQGVTRDHWVELVLEEPKTKNTPQYLIATGWIHPTDSSINVAIAQGSHTPPQGLTLEVPDGKGGWTVGKPGLGFPEGKIKTVVLNLAGVFKPNTPRRVRLRTNLEIYWDYIGTANERTTAPIRTHPLTLTSANLRYRGFSAVRQKDFASPEIGIYDKVASTKPIWLDLEGYYTRFGEVNPLLAQIDDRYVIMNAGDEMRLKFGATPKPQTGWVRDYVLKGDGWVKDGNFNTAFSKTVMPLPSHAGKTYDVAPKTLEDDPVYRQHPQDWQNYHTRYVSSREFFQAMLPKTR